MTFWRSRAKTQLTYPTFCPLTLSNIFEHFWELGKWKRGLRSEKSQRPSKDLTRYILLPKKADGRGLDSHFLLSIIFWKVNNRIYNFSIVSIIQWKPYMNISCSTRLGEHILSAGTPEKRMYWLSQLQRARREYSQAGAAAVARSSMCSQVTLNSTNVYMSLSPSAGLSSIPFK